MLLNVDQSVLVRYPFCNDVAAWNPISCVLSDNPPVVALAAKVTALCLALVLAATSVLLETSVSKSLMSEAVSVCHVISVPSDCKTCPAVPTASLSVTFDGFLIIMSPRVVIGSENPLDAAAHAGSPPTTVKT